MAGGAEASRRPISPHRKTGAAELHAAIKERDWAHAVTLARLYKRMGRLDLLNAREEVTGATPLISILLNGKEGDVNSVFLELLKCGACPVQRDEHNRSALSWATRVGNFFLTSALLSGRGWLLDPLETILDSSAIPEHIATQILPFLLPDLNEQDDEGFAPLHFACMSNKSVNVSHILVGAGARTDMRTLAGDTLLHCAARRGSSWSVSFCLDELGADPWVKNNKGMLAGVRDADVLVSDSLLVSKILSAARERNSYL
jgi:hypothetical protein